MENQFINKHPKFMASLASNERITVKKNTYSFNLSSNEMFRTSTQLFPIEILKIYDAIDSIQLLWKSNPDFPINYLDAELDFVEGEFNLIEKGKFFDGMDFSYLKEEYDFKLDKSMTMYLFPFEVLQDEYLVCINTNDHDQIIFLDIDKNQTHKIPIDFATYLNYGYKNYFFYGWQKAVLLNSTIQKEKLKHYLTQLFPDYNFKYLTL